MSRPLPDHEGIVLYRKARSTGTHVGLYKSDEAGIESDPDYPWATVCEEHAGVVCHATRREAESYLSHPEDWCPTCQGHEKEEPKTSFPSPPGSDCGAGGAAFCKFHPGVCETCRRISEGATQ